MRRVLAPLLVIALALAALPAPAAADPPTRVTVIAVFNPITYGDNAYINGQLFGASQAGQVVTLEQAPPPYTDWTPVAQVTSDAQSYYSFKLQPTQTMQYRTSSQGTPSDRVVEVDVAPRITLAASFAGKTAVRYTGALGPALDGQRVAIQRRGSSGAWITVATPLLHDGGLFEGRLKARRPTQLRAFFASNGDLLAGYSNKVVARPPRRKGRH